MLRGLAYRLYQGFLMSPRLGEYERLLTSLSASGYRFLTLTTLAACSRREESLPALACIIRNDVDTDPETASRMFDLERALGVRATYYFRMGTFDAPLMRRIAAHGSEVGYHYEELATIAKQRGLRTKADLDAHLPSIRETFSRNIEAFAGQAGRLPTTIASHGDWINRKLGVPNSYAIDSELRARFGIVAEAYDEWLNRPVQARFADHCGAPNWWMPHAPDESIALEVSCLYFLVHPRQWRANPMENLRVDATRAAEGLAYRWRCHARGLATSAS